MTALQVDFDAVEAEFLAPADNVAMREDRRIDLVKVLTKTRVVVDVRPGQCRAVCGTVTVVHLCFYARRRFLAGAAFSFVGRLSFVFSHGGPPLHWG